MHEYMRIKTTFCMRTYHDLLLVLDGVEVAGEGEQSLAHLSCVVEISERFEQWNNAQQLAVT